MTTATKGSGNVPKRGSRPSRAPTKRRETGPVVAGTELEGGYGLSPSVETTRPRTVVELGAGASSLVCARALALNGGGRLVSFDQHADFVAATAKWLREEGVEAELRHAPLNAYLPGWPGPWYEMDDVSDTIDLLIIDGPPWSIHPLRPGRGGVAVRP